MSMEESKFPAASPALGWASLEGFELQQVLSEDPLAKTITVLCRSETALGCPEMAMLAAENAASAPQQQYVTQQAAG